MSKLEEVSYEVLVFLHPRVSSRVAGCPVASPCLCGKPQNLSFSKVSKELVMLFCVACVALCDISICLITCGKRENWRKSYEMLVFLHSRVLSPVSGFPVASPCLWGELENISLTDVSEFRVVIVCYCGASCYVLFTLLWPSSAILSFMCKIWISTNSSWRNRCSKIWISTNSSWQNRCRCVNTCVSLLILTLYAGCSDVLTFDSVNTLTLISNDLVNTPEWNGNPCSDSYSIFNIRVSIRVRGLHLVFWGGFGVGFLDVPCFFIVFPAVFINFPLVFASFPAFFLHFP